MLANTSGTRSYNSHHAFIVRDRSLITGRGDYKMGNSQVQNLLCPPPPTRQDKTFCAPPTSFKEWKLFVPSITMAKTSSSHVKTTSKPCMPPPPPLQHG